MPHGPKPTTTGRSCTAGGLADELVADVRATLMFGSSANLQQLGFVAGFEVDGVDEQQLAVLLARIVAALEQGEAEQLLVADAQALDDGGAQGFVGMVQGQLEFGDS
jgi:hypothetical protein